MGEIGAWGRLCGYLWRRLRIWLWRGLYLDDQGVEKVDAPAKRSVDCVFPGCLRVEISVKKDGSECAVLEEEDLIE